MVYRHVVAGFARMGYALNSTRYKLLGFYKCHAQANAVINVIKM